MDHGYGSWVWIACGSGVWIGPLHVDLQPYVIYPFLATAQPPGFLVALPCCNTQAQFVKRFMDHLQFQGFHMARRQRCNFHQFSLIFLKYFMKKSGDKGIATKTESTKLDSRGASPGISAQQRKDYGDTQGKHRETKAQPFERNPKDDTQTKTQLGRLQAIQRKTNAERHQTKSQ